ncbi:MAG: hypothetical protein M3115_05655, partial [Thermoproteota archaeon]|nr:hypothetical protein [Thermoproteota archaeon]
PLKPYTNQNTLTLIEDFLKKRTSCFVNVKARQPQFEEVRMDFCLKLHDQYKDFTYYSNLLKEEITKYLTPWAYNSSADVQFVGKLYKSSLINFIEEQYYVDYITDVELFVKVDNVTPESGDMEEITASTGRSVLVSVPASKHSICQITEEDEIITVECVDPMAEQESV